MFANSLADVVAEEAAKRLLLVLNLERKAKKAERIGIGVAKRLALVQAYIWAKRGAAADTNELEPLLAVKETCTRSAIGKLVDELAQQGHFLVRHNMGLKCKACNAYRADRQFSFWNRTPCVPRPCAAEVISQSRNKKNSTTRTQTIQLTGSLFSHRSVRTSKALTFIWIDSPRLYLLSLKVTLRTHTQQFSTCASPSQIGEQCDGSRHVGMDGKSR